MDKLTASKILGVSTDSTKEEIKNAYRRIMEEVTLEENPETFVKVQSAYRFLIRGNKNSLSHNVKLNKPKHRHVLQGYEDCRNSKDLKKDEVEAYFENMPGLNILSEHEKDNSMFFRKLFIEAMQRDRSEYDYRELLSLVKKANLDRLECEEIAASFTSMKNIVKFGKKRLRRKDGFDEFMDYIFSRIDRQYRPALLRIRDYIVSIGILLLFAQGLIRAFIEETAGMKPSEVAEGMIPIELFIFEISIIAFAYMKTRVMEGFQRFFIMTITIIGVIGGIPLLLLLVK